MTDLAPAATETVAPAIPAPRGSAGSAWLKWLARRIGLAILTLWLCSVLVFFATAALGDPVRASLGKDYASSPERAAALAAALHLDQPVIVRYFAWLGGLLTGHLGTSIANGLPVGELVGPRIVNSAVLVPVAPPSGTAPATGRSIRRRGHRRLLSLSRQDLQARATRTRAARRKT